MTVDADITAEILRNIRDEVKATREELKVDIASVKADVGDLRADVAEIRTEIGVMNLRLSGVERVLVSVAYEQHSLSQFVKELAQRVDKLEERDPTPA